MMTTASHALNLLKGPHFADAVRPVCATLPEVEPIDGLRYRHILAAGALGGEKLFATLGFIAHALRMRGAQVTLLQCDSVLPACVAKIVSHHESACTRWCHANAAPFAEAMNLPCRWYSEFLPTSDRAECDYIAADLAADQITDFVWRGVDLGPLVALSVRRFFQRGNVDMTDEPVTSKARDYLRSALYLRVIAERALDALEIEKVYMTDGVYVDWGVVRAVARLKGIPVDFFIDGLRGHTLTFLSDPAPDRTQPTRSWERWRDIPLHDEQQNRLDEYLAHRSHKPFDIHPTPWDRAAPSDADVRRRLPIIQHTDGLVFGMFPNIGFDACVGMTKDSYSRSVDWIVETIEFFAHHPRHSLIIRAHPHEAWAKRPAIDRIESLIAQRFPRLPANIHLVEPESNIRASSIIDLMDVGLIYISTVAVEAAVRGKPSLLVGGGLHAHTGIAYDVEAGDDYGGLLSAICERRFNPTVDVQLARRYAYYVFFRRDLPVDCFETFDWDVTQINMKSLAELAPGQNRAMDIICNGILRDDPLEYASSADLETGSLMVG